MRKKHIEKLFTLVIATTLVGCGWMKKDARDKDTSGEDAVAETEQANEVTIDEAAVDSFGFMLFDETVNVATGWESEQAEYRPDNAIADEKIVEAKTIVSACLVLPSAEVGVDIGFTADAANLVCGSDAKKLDLNWKTEISTNQ